MNMRDISGLPVGIEEGMLTFKEGLRGVEPFRRRHLDMASVLLDPPAGSATVYLVYRDIAQPWQRVLFYWAGLRYDMTLMHPCLLGREYAKTMGHYHSSPPGSGLTYPEVYQVLSGRACFLLQRQASTCGDAAEVVLVEGTAGDILLVPPGYGHVTVNLSLQEPLLVANLVASEAVSLYQPMVGNGGAAFYVTPAGLWRNPNYPRTPVPTWAYPPDPLKAGMNGRVPLYAQFTMNPMAFDFLSHPERHRAPLARYTEALKSPGNKASQAAWPILPPDCGALPFSGSERAGSCGA